jgi:hypothetical protein
MTDRLFRLALGIALGCVLAATSALAQGRRRLLRYPSLALPRTFQFDPVALSFTPDFNTKSLRGNVVMRWEYPAARSFSSGTSLRPTS